MSKGKLGFRAGVFVLIMSAAGLALFASCSDDPEPEPGETAAPTPALTKSPEPMEPSMGLTPIADPATDPILQQGAIYATLDDDWDEMAQGVQDLVPLAVEDGKIHITAYGVDHTDALCEAFTAEYGIECEGRGINAGQIVGTLTAEREAGEAPTDVVFMSMTQMGQYVDKGFAAELDWEALGVEPRRSWEALEGIEGNAAGVGNDQYTNFYRTDEFSEADLPKTIADWLDPKYKGLVCAPSFLFRAGNGFIAFYYDKDEMVDIHKRMIEENDLLVTDDCNDFILSGERPLMYLGYGNPPVLLDSGVIGQFWNPGFGVNMFNVAVASNAPNPNAARLFAAWHTSRDASRIMWEVVGRGWAAYGHAAEGLTSGSFKDIDLVFESVPVFRRRGDNAKYFADRVFGTQ